MLELKEIQRSLPHATQPLNDPDLPELDARGIPRTHFLKNVPVGLVPLIGPDPATSPTSPTLATTPCSVVSSKLESPPCHSPPSRPPPSPPSTPPPRIVGTNPPLQKTLKPPKPPSPPTCTTEPWVPPPPPPRLPYNIPIQPRPSPRFNFLPLLETPASPVSNPTSQPCQSPPLRAPPLPASQDLPRLPPDRTLSPRDEKIESSSVPSCHSAQPVKPFSPTRSVGGTTTVPGLGATTTPDRQSNRATQLRPSSPRSSPPSSSSNTKGAPLEESTRLEADLTRLWHGHSCSTDGETEAEESEAESSVVHTEADSDCESAHARRVVASSGSTKVVRTPVAVATTADTDDVEEGEMSLVELENGVITFVRTPRRR
jgi:hypothetical protein